MIYKNKRGDISITILVIGTFVLCAFAILTFIFSDFKTSNSFVGIDIVNKLNSEVDAYKFYKNNDKKIPSELSIRAKGDGEEFYLFKTKPGSIWTGNEEVFLFSVQYPVPS